jgi:hypothetical protein
MLTSKKNLLLRILFIFSLLNIPQYNYPTLTQDFTITAYQSYIIACITSCCIGMVLCAFIQKYCDGPSVAILKEKQQKKEAHQDFFKKLETKVDSIEQHEQKIVNLLNKHFQQTNALLILQEKNVQTRMTELTLKIKVLRKKEKEFLEISEEFKKNSFCLPIAAALYWFKKYNTIMDKVGAPLNIAQT